jgi:alpha-galactosidase
VPAGDPIPAGELVHDHFGSPSTETVPGNDVRIAGDQVKLYRLQRELGDLGRGDYRIPAIHIRYPEGHTVSHFEYKSHDIVPGKPKLGGLPCTWGSDKEVTTLHVRMVERRSGLEAVLSYSIFRDCGAIARSVRLENKGKGMVEIMKLASWGGDLEVGEWEMIQLCGDQVREAKEIRRPVYPGTQG